jgi:hypothetical protein
MNWRICHSKQLTSTFGGFWHWSMPPPKGKESSINYFYFGGFIMNKFLNAPIREKMSGKKNQQDVRKSHRRQEKIRRKAERNLKFTAVYA